MTHYTNQNLKDPMDANKKYCILSRFNNSKTSIGSLFLNKLLSCSVASSKKQSSRQYRNQSVIKIQTFLHSKPIDFISYIFFRKLSIISGNFLSLIQAGSFLTLTPLIVRGSLPVFYFNGGK